MYFDALTAAAVGDELRAELLGGFIQKLVLPGPDAVALEVYAGHARHQLLLSGETANPRACLVSERPTAQPGLVTPFGLLLRKHVLDGRIEAIEQPATERVISLRVGKRGEDGAERAVWLSAELMGRHSNLLLLDGERTTVLESAKRVTPRMSGVRPVLPKRPYTPPPPRQGLQPHRTAPADLEGLAEGAKPATPLAQLLVSGVAGMSPLAAREIVFRSAGSVDARVRDWTEWAVLAAQLRRVAALWATREWRPCVAAPLEEGGVVAYAPYELTHLAEGAELSFPPSMSAAIEAYGSGGGVAGAAEGLVSHGQLRAQVLGSLEKRADRVRQRLASLRGQQAGAEDARSMMEDGQLVLAYAYAIEPGQAELVLEDRTIALDPTRSPSEHAQALFEEYRRRQRATQDIPALAEEAERELALIEEYRTFAQMAEGHAELSQVRAEAVEAGAIRDAGAGGAKARKPPESKLSAFTAPDGTRILVGRSAGQNAKVLDTAAPHDWWFHARELPGGHVVARTGGAEPSPETSRIAAETAAYYSSARSASSVEVITTQLRNVRKIKGAGPGQVTYRNERGMRVEPKDHLGEG